VKYANYVADDVMPSAEPSLANRMRLAVVRLNRRLRAQRIDSTITLTQLSALSCLEKSGPLTPGELAARERVQPPSMTRVIAALEEHGLASRRPHPTDGRQAIVAITDAGLRHLAVEAAARERWLDRQLAELTDDERELLTRAVEVIDRMAGG
jgi:DNA-binding MarR family transcriptional regulator